MAQAIKVRLTAASVIMMVTGSGLSMSTFTGLEMYGIPLMKLA